MAAKKTSNVVPAHANLVMRRIARLARAFPLANAQARLDEIAELATGKVDCSPAVISTHRGRPAAQASEDFQQEETPDEPPKAEPATDS